MEIDLREMCLYSQQHSTWLGSLSSLNASSGQIHGHENSKLTKEVKNFTKTHSSQDSVVGIETRLRTGQSGFSVPVWKRDLQTSIPLLGLAQASHSLRTWSHLSVISTYHLLLTPRLRMSRAEPLLPLYALMAWTREIYHILSLLHAG
jgi:hypothetical protein